MYEINQKLKNSGLVCRECPVCILPQPICKRWTLLSNDSFLVSGSKENETVKAKKTRNYHYHYSLLFVCFFLSLVKDKIQ